jgi:hypothetical protein
LFPHDVCQCILQERLTCLDTSMTWPDMQAKLQQDPGRFEVCIWPGLSAQGWSMQDSSGSSIGSDTSSSSGGGSRAAAFTPPSTIIAACQYASTGPDPGMPSCSSPQQVLTVLDTSGQHVPEQCVQLLRAAEADQHMAAVLAVSGRPSSPHRVCADPSGRLAGLPTSKRHLVRGHRQTMPF